MSLAQDHVAHGATFNRHGINVLVGVYPDIDEDQAIFVFFRERLFHGGVELHRLAPGLGLQWNPS